MPARTVRNLGLAFRFLGWRLSDIFRDEPSWAEFFSAVALGAYTLSMPLGGKGPEEWESLNLLTDILPGWWWVGFVGGGAAVQMLGLILNIRFIRACAAFGALNLVALIGVMVWPLFPYSPLLVGFVTAVGLPNFFVIARHARDW